ncbi:HAD family hydrolase [Akkermansia muciniphila]|uniref:HAD family hydrolase n=1 Tax=Akkermansia muciniphila TaxID=239935 RepID=UPI001BFF4822|nr:HAD hydrolase-like protein [Akkermansia muciniphila]MBT8777128.1 HAD hydrolase-like protein [Akkermansia muciniphila]
MIKLIAFDLDGTIGETVPMCIRAFEQAVSPYAGRTLSEREITQTFGLNEVGMIKVVAGEKWREALHDFYPVYEQMHDECPEPYEGIRELIHTLKDAGILVALITGKGEKSCRITLEKFGMQDLFCSVKTGAEDRPNKAEAIEELLDAYHVAKDEFYYIGDAVSDVTACKKADVPCLSAAWGTTADISGLEEANPSRVFFSIEDLSHFLLHLREGT